MADPFHVHAKEQRPFWNFFTLTFLCSANYHEKKFSFSSFYILFKLCKATNSNELKNESSAMKKTFTKTGKTKEEERYKKGRTKRFNNIIKKVKSYKYLWRHWTDSITRFCVYISLLWNKLFHQFTHFTGLDLNMQTTKLEKFRIDPFRMFAETFVEHEENAFSFTVFSLPAFTLLRWK